VAKLAFSISWTAGRSAITIGSMTSFTPPPS
jgi:hypothetical protein